MILRSSEDVAGAAVSRDSKPLVTTQVQRVFCPPLCGLFFAHTVYTVGAFQHRNPAYSVSVISRCPVSSVRLQGEPRWRTPALGNPPTVAGESVRQ